MLGRATTCGCGLERAAYHWAQRTGIGASPIGRRSAERTPPKPSASRPPHGASRDRVGGTRNPCPLADVTRRSLLGTAHGHTSHVLNRDALPCKSLCRPCGAAALTAV